MKIQSTIYVLLDPIQYTHMHFQLIIYATALQASGHVNGATVQAKASWSRGTCMILA